MIREVKAKILQQQKIGEYYFRLRLLCPEIARVAQPGQFVMLRIAELHDPFLRRPFSFSRILPPRDRKRKTEKEGILEIWYEVVGKGTSLMTRLRAGEQLDLLGPLGRGFWEVPGQKKAILVGGGVGIAPLIAWAEKLQGKKKGTKALSSSVETPAVLVLIGGQSRRRILGSKECQKMGLDPQVSTEDGSLGKQGVVTDLLERELLTSGHSSTTIYTCGPMAMLAKVAQIADQFDIPCQVLLESRMACGVGACLGCAVKVRAENLPPGVWPSAEGEGGGEYAAEGGFREEGISQPAKSLIPGIGGAPQFRYARACKEGPVFEARYIIWEGY